MRIAADDGKAHEAVIYLIIPNDRSIYPTYSCLTAFRSSNTNQILTITGSNENTAKAILPVIVMIKTDTKNPRVTSKSPSKRSFGINAKAPPNTCKAPKIKSEPTPSPISAKKLTSCGACINLARPAATLIKDITMSAIFETKFNFSPFLLPSACLGLWAEVGSLSAQSAPAKTVAPAK